MRDQPDAEKRITELEIQLAHVQHLYEQLNEVVIDQSQRLDRLQRLAQQLESQLKELKEKPPETPDPLEEKPPHY